MEIKPIKTEADYEAALKEIEQLWDQITVHQKGISLMYLLHW